MTSIAPRNAWYPLTWSRNVTRKLAAQRVLGIDLVVYRTESGDAVALDDVCPHRLAPLSMGKLKGDAVECGYHGMTFAADGRCIRIPGQKGDPRECKGVVLSAARENGLGVDLAGRSGYRRSVADL